MSYSRNTPIDLWQQEQEGPRRQRWTQAAPPIAPDRRSTYIQPDQESVSWAENVLSNGGRHPHRRTHHAHEGDHPHRQPSATEGKGDRRWRLGGSGDAEDETARRQDSKTARRQDGETANSKTARRRDSKQQDGETARQRATAKDEDKPITRSRSPIADRRSPNSRSPITPRGFHRRASGHRPASDGVVRLVATGCHTVA